MRRKNEIVENARKLVLSLGSFNFEEGLLAFHRGIVSNPYFAKTFVDPQIRIIISIDSDEFCLERTRQGVPLVWYDGEEGKITHKLEENFGDIDHHIQVVLTMSPEIKNEGKRKNRESN